MMVAEKVKEITAVEARTAIDERIRELYAENGVVTPDMVIEDAKDPDSPLHDSFEWDLEVAALSAWRDTARSLIRSVRVIITTEDLVFEARGQREFLSDPYKKANEQGYVTKAVIKTDRERAMASIELEIERVEAAIRRMESIAIDLDIDKEIVNISGNINALKRKMKMSA